MFERKFSRVPWLPSNRHAWLLGGFELRFLGTTQFSLSL